MKLNLKKIINIKNEKDLKKFNLNKPIFHNNYLFHYLIIFNKLDILKLYKYPIYKENNNNYNGFHLAAQYDFDILCYLIKNYPNYLYNRNNKDKTFVDLLPLNKIIIIYNKYPDLNWDILLSYNLFSEMISNAEYKYIKKINTDVNRFTILINVALSKVISTENKILFYNKFTDNELNMKDEYRYGLLLYINEYDFKLINYFVNRNVDIFYFTNGGNNPFYNALNKDMNYNKFKISKILFNKLLNTNIDFINEYDKYLDTIGHIILLYKINNNLNNKLPLYILKHCNNECFNFENIDNNSLFDLIVLLDYEIYSKLVIDKSISKRILDRIINNYSDTRWIQLLQTLPIYNNCNNIDKYCEILFNNYKYVHFSFYDAKIIDVLIYIKYIDTKYKNIYIPVIKNIIQYTKINYACPFIITYKNQNNYYIHPYLNNLINANKESNIYEYGLIYIHCIQENGLHASILIYNFKNLTIERFNPLENINDNDIDNILEEELTWNTGFKYLYSEKNIPDINLQMISNESDATNFYILDFGGYCLAWCFCFIELRVQNKNIKTYILIKKIIKKIVMSNITLKDYIRNYTNILGNEKIKLLKKNKIEYTEYSKQILKRHNFNLLLNKLKKYFMLL
jgi:hypothetical protein